MSNEESIEHVDEETIEYMKDIWSKAGEMENSEMEGSDAESLELSKKRKSS